MTQFNRRVSLDLTRLYFWSHPTPLLLVVLGCLQRSLLPPPWCLWKVFGLQKANSINQSYLLIYFCSIFTFFRGKKSKWSPLIFFVCVYIYFFNYIFYRYVHIFLFLFRALWGLCRQASHSGCCVSKGSCSRAAGWEQLGFTFNFLELKSLRQRGFERYNLQQVSDLPV